VGLLAAFTLWQARAASPLLPPRVIQQTLHYSPVSSGLAFLPLIGMVVVAANLSNVVLLPRLGPRPLVTVGMLLATGGSVAHYLTSHLSPATLVHGRPSPSLTAMSLIHGYTTGFWVAAAIFGAGAVICGTLLRFGPLRTSGQQATTVRVNISLGEE
jgi:hypothetical protein